MLPKCTLVSRHLFPRFTCGLHLLQSLVVFRRCIMMDLSVAVRGECMNKFGNKSCRMKWWFQPSNQEKSIIQLVFDRLVIRLVSACGRRQKTHVNTHHSETEGLSWFSPDRLLLPCSSCILYIPPPADDPETSPVQWVLVCRWCVCAVSAPICVRIWGGTSSVSESFLKE